MGEKMSKRQQTAEQIYDQIIHTIDQREGKAIPPESLKNLAEAFALVSENVGGV